jgi:hypothetical protein
MLESGLSGSVRGVPSNGHPYRDPGSWAALSTANSRGGFTSDIGPVDPLAGAAPENRRPRMARKWRIANHCSG